MHCFIYKSPKKTELYLYTTVANDFSAVPNTLLEAFGAPGFLMELELTPERKLARENTAEVLRCLAEQGFFLQLPPTQGEKTLQ